MSHIIVEGSLEVKLPTIWTDEKQRWAESEKRREEERRSKKRKSETRSSWSSRLSSPPLVSAHRPSMLLLSLRRAPRGEAPRYEQMRQASYDSWALGDLSTH